MQKEKYFYFKLFWYMFRLSACTLGGGYVIVPFMRDLFVDRLHWIAEEEMLDYVALSQSAPGAVAVNASVMVGYRLGGLRGLLVSVCGTVLPPLLLLSVLSYVYSFFITNAVIAGILKGMQACIAAVVADVVVSLASPYIKTRKFLSVVLMAAAFLAVAVWKVNAVYVVLAGMGVGIFLTVVRQKRGMRNGLS